MYELLQQYFKGKIEISEGQFEQVKNVFTPKTAQRGEILLRSGDPCRQVFFVAKGCLRSYVIDDKGKEFVIQFAPENWWITDLNSFYSQETAMFFIDVIEPAAILAGEKDFQQKLEAIHPDFNPLFNRLIRNSYRALQKRLVNQLVATAEDRYLDFLNTYPDLARRIPQRMIASYLGVMPESLSRIRKELSKK
ncbi:Crp/Fnr family transcriptional regulator [Chitinophagaceae bacterium LB-8]|uniref:Crp/Fnr family transcriptional regulator n=1 Tax=Paraflavisolibacter caeni TaxID=2982496 RepID=A0A9X3B8G0_9BACT|nr:Crp/Fnr family transcriptional regulator [Paraflavisolibacter caeni]MCU7550685.1 Crp/Fnr family transcriptional regulator [Paraflavisolibacter caeni]